MRPSNNLEQKTPSGIYWRVQLVCMKVQAHNFHNSEPDAFDESRFIMTFLTILGVTEILCSFKWVVEGKAGKEIHESSRLEFLEKFLANNSALSDTEDNTFGPLNRGCNSRFTFVEIATSNLPKLQAAKFPGSDKLFCFISICKFGSFKNPFATITSLSELYFRFRRLFCWYKQIKMIFVNKQHKQLKTMEWGLTWYLRWGINTSIPTWTH